MLVTLSKDTTSLVFQITTRTSNMAAGGNATSSGRKSDASWGSSMSTQHSSVAMGLAELGQYSDLQAGATIAI